VIVRVAGTGQYRLPDEHAGALNELDNEAVAAVEAGDEERFRQVFGRMIDLVRSKGEPLPDDDLTSSDVILPPPDTSLAEASADFTGEGLIPERN
jgi:hypothetical protein